MQSNANRLRVILKLSKYLLFALGILIIIFDINDIDWLSSIISGLWLLACIIYSCFSNRLWKKKFINNKLKIFKDYYCPVISGRWEGTLTRNGATHGFVIEIKQTYTTISCETYSQNSYSKSICAELLYDQQNECYSLVYLWEGKTAKGPNGEDKPSDNFIGTTILRINENCGTLIGEYYTNRSPSQTKGQINMNYRQDKLKNSF